MFLNVQERLVLMELLPREGGILTLRVANELRDVLVLTDEEVAKVGLKQEGMAVTWKQEVDLNVDVAISVAGRGLIVEELNKLQDHRKLTPGHITLYEKFVEQPEKKDGESQDS